MIIDPQKITEIDELEHSIDSMGLSKEIVPFLIEVLKTTRNRFLINKIAITLRDIKDDRAVEPIVDMLKKKDELTPKGNLMTALQGFDYGPYTDILFDLLLYGNYEVSCKAYDMLQSVNFQLTSSQKNKLEQRIDDFKDNISRLEDFLVLVTEGKRDLNREIGEPHPL